MTTLDEMNMSYGRQKGFSLFELTVVLIVIAFLIYMGYRSYFGTIADSQVKAISYQADTFSRTVTNIRGMAIASNSTTVVMDKAAMDSTPIYVNEYGWPANTDPGRSPKSSTQTAEECRQLWYGLFENAPKAVIKGKVKDRTADYEISTINGHICRYELTRKEEGTYFFDYSVITGTVFVSQPEG